MEYQKLIDLFANTPDQSSKFRTKNRFKINNDSCAMSNTNSQIRPKTLKLKSSLCSFSGPYILFKKTKSVANTAAADADTNNTGKKVICKDCASFTNFISHMKNTQVDNAKDINGVMPMYNLIKHSDINSKTSRILW